MFPVGYEIIWSIDTCMALKRIGFACTCIEYSHHMESNIDAIVIHMFISEWQCQIMRSCWAGTGELSMIKKRLSFVFWSKVFKDSMIFNIYPTAETNDSVYNFLYAITEFFVEEVDSFSNLCMSCYKTLHDWFGILHLCPIRGFSSSNSVIISLISAGYLLDIS